MLQLPISLITQYVAAQILLLFLLCGLVVWLAKRSITHGEAIISLAAQLRVVESNHLEHLKSDVDQIKAFLNL